MEYEWAQYQADRALLLFRNSVAFPIVAGLKLQLRAALARADAADHPVIREAHDRLLAVAKAGPPGPQPPMPDPAEHPENRQSAGTRSTANRAVKQGAGDAKTRTAGPRIKETKAEAAEWAKGLRAQAERHADRRQDWPAVDPGLRSAAVPGE